MRPPRHPYILSILVRRKKIILVSDPILDPRDQLPFITLRKSFKKQNGTWVFGYDTHILLPFKLSQVWVNC